MPHLPMVGFFMDLFAVGQATITQRRRPSPLDAILLCKVCDAGGVIWTLFC